MAQQGQHLTEIITDGSWAGADAFATSLELVDAFLEFWDAPPPGAPGDGPRHRRGRRPVPEDPRPPPQRHHQGAGRRHPPVAGGRRRAQGPRPDGRGRRRSCRCSPTPRPTSTASSSGASAPPSSARPWPARSPGRVTGITPPSSAMPIKLGLLPPYRLGVASDPGVDGRLRPPRRRGRGSSRCSRWSTSPCPVGLREPLPLQRHRPHAAARGLRAARPARPAGLAGRSHRPASGSAPASSCSRSTTPSSSPSAAPPSTASPAAACSSASASAGCARRSRRSGIDPDERGSRTDEAIDALRVIWQEDEPTFDGQHFRFGPVRSHPKPAQPTIPILVGGHSRGGRPPGRRTRRRLLPARPERRRARRALGAGPGSSPSRPAATRRDRR